MLKLLESEEVCVTVEVHETNTTHASGTVRYQDSRGSGPLKEFHAFYQDGWVIMPASGGGRFSHNPYLDQMAKDEAIRKLRNTAQAAA